MSDDYLYFKFKPVNKYLIESLVKPSLYFPTPDKVNDPFDCRLDIRKSFQRAAEVATGMRRNSLLAALNSGILLEMFSGQFHEIGVCSFSLLEGSFDEPLLWSHYADSHKGVCLLYRFPEAFLDDPKKIIGVDRVQYGTNVLTDWLVNSDVQPSEGDDFVTGLIRTYLTSKNKPWEYEKEARIIRPTHGALDIPHGFLEQVCFGLQTPKEDIDLVTKLAREHSGCKRFVRAVPGDTDFGITVMEL
ncbi:DUF2971 domain-containing protein [Sideroxydans sp. CL21]|uniref:DUF2971 domain-containing protein n=1 Tax=Sideroxydans sp. CL21 TaxID=2600596 RepID=UPI0012A8883B|nr:DUF2971 domain-containing protein [Sideroxydans sp. CL21]VVC82429.1 hypothetical protein [Sideroxydans sp. CL21]